MPAVATLVATALVVRPTLRLPPPRCRNANPHRDSPLHELRLRRGMRAKSSGNLLVARVACAAGMTRAHRIRCDDDRTLTAPGAVALPPGLIELLDHGRDGQPRHLAVSLPSRAAAARMI